MAEVGGNPEKCRTTVVQGRELLVGGSGGWGALLCGTILFLFWLVCFLSR